MTRSPAPAPLDAVPPSVSSLAHLVERAYRLAAGPRRILGVAGAPGSGKSTLAAAVVEALEGRAVLVPMDGFHLANSELARLGRRARKGAPDTFDGAGYVELLRRLRSPGPDPVYAPVFDRALEEAVAGAVGVDPHVPLVVTEGNYLLVRGRPWEQVRPLLDEAWFVTGDDRVRRERLVARHVAYGRTPEQAEEWVSRSDDANAAFVAESSAAADLVVDSTVMPHPGER